MGQDGKVVVYLGQKNQLALSIKQGAEKLVQELPTIAKYVYPQIPTPRHNAMHPAALLKMNFEFFSFFVATR